MNYCACICDYCSNIQQSNYQYCNDNNAFGYPDGAFNYTVFISR